MKVKQTKHTTHLYTENDKNLDIPERNKKKNKTMAFCALINMVKAHFVATDFHTKTSQ